MNERNEACEGEDEDRIVSRGRRSMYHLMNDQVYQIFTLGLLLKFKVLMGQLSQETGIVDCRTNLVVLQ